jgi:hypothetical protein
MELQKKVWMFAAMWAVAVAAVWAVVTPSVSSTLALTWLVGAAIGPPAIVMAIVTTRQPARSLAHMLHDVDAGRS